MRKYIKITIAVFLLMGMFLTPPVWAAQEDKESLPQPCLGVRLDPNPLPELLTKHLQLNENQGLLIVNVMEHSPAAEADLQRDDIIVTFEGRDVSDYRAFVDAIRKKNVGDPVTLEIIHLGQRRQVKITLAACDQEGSWKYPFSRLEDELQKQRRFPGRVFRLEPGEKSWRQIPWQDMPEPLHRYFHQQRVIRIDDKLELEITGDPRSDEARITVRDLKENKEFHITPDNIDQLPKEYRQPVRDALENAEKTAPDSDFRPDWPQPEMPRGYREFDIDRFKENMQREMQEFQERLMREMDRRLEQLEKSHRLLRQKLNQLLEKQPADETPESPQEKEDSADL